MTDREQAMRDLIHKLGNALQEIEQIALMSPRTGPMIKIRAKALAALELKFSQKAVKCV